MRHEKFTFNGYQAEIIIPDNPNGKWIWKTEFFGAFDKAEQKLCEMGYTRVYYCISDKYGSYRAVRLMHNFYLHIVKKYDLNEKCCLFGFSRGGLYAFNFALFYPEHVEKIYLDAPVLDMRIWPEEEGEERVQLFNEYSLNEESLKSFNGHPIDNMAEFFSHKIPVLLIAGAKDEVVGYETNAGKMIKYCQENGIDLKFIVKPDGLHHPHSLDDVTPIINFILYE